MSSPTISAPIAELTPVVDNSPKMETLKINGKDITVSIDELKRAYGLHKAADGKFQEAAKMRKDADSMKEVFSKKDINNLIQAGWSEDEIEEKAADFLVKRAQRKTMTPQQLAQYEREQEYEVLKKEKDDRVKTEQLKAKQELEAREATLYQTAFLKDVEAVNAKTWLDLEDPVILTNVINEISTALQRYEYDMSVTEAVKRVEERMEKRGVTKKDYLRKLLKSSIKDIDDNDLEAFLEKGGKGVREKSVEVYKKAESPFAKQKPQAQSNTPVETPIIRDAQYYRNIRMGRSHLNKK